MSAQPPAKTARNDGRSGGDAGDADEDPECLAQIDDIKEPAEKDAEDSQRGDHDAKRSGQRIDDAL